MNIQDILTLYDYSCWAWRQILTAADQLTSEQFLAPNTQGYGTLRGTLVHALEAEWAWRMLCQHQTIDFFKALQEEAFPTVSSIAQHWQEEEQAMRDYLASLTDEDLTGYIRYTTPEGEKRERVLWHCLYQVLNHATQHRSEAAVVLTDYHSSPGDLDFTVFLNQRI